MTEPSSKSQWPGVERAYDFVLPSYQWAITRFEAADTRLQTLLMFIVTVTVAIPPIATTVIGTPVLNSWWFLGALGVAGVAVLLGLIARLKGTLKLTSPAVLYSPEWLRKDESAFRRDMVGFAGQHYERNRLLINSHGG